MIDVNKLPEFPGFTVYDAETGKPVKQINKGYRFNDAYDAFMLSQDGKIFEIEDGWWGANEDGRCLCREVCETPHSNKYIIQMGTGEYYKW